GRSGRSPTAGTSCCAAASRPRSRSPMSDLITPSQTVGPFLALGLTWPTGYLVVPEDTPGAIRITGRVLDGAGAPVPDGVVETWQADADGRFDHPDDPRGRTNSGFCGFGRCNTD